MVDYPTLVGNNIVTNENNFGNVEELLAVVNLKLILGITLNFQFLTIYAIIAPSNSCDTVWFTRIKECLLYFDKPYRTPEISSDDYGHKIVAGQGYIIGNFLEKPRSNSKRHYFKVDIITSNFYLESLVCPFHNSQKINMIFSLKILNMLKLLTSLSIWYWHPCLLFDFIYTILQFTGFVDI